MLRAYLPILLLIGFVVFIAAVILGVSTFTGGKPQRTAVKGQAYESGIAPLGDARERFSVKFYLVAMLFIVFDIETVFMIPWGVHFRQLSCAVPLTAAGACPAGQLSFFGLGEMLVFMAILVVGLVYVWRKGALQWD
jgi:NADH-quinone oxidoreductase subunit A